MLMQVWDVFPVEGNVAGIVAGVVGALLVHTIASQLKFNNGTRLLIAIAGFGGAYGLTRSTLGMRAEREFRTHRIEREMMSQSPIRILVEHEPGFRAKAKAFVMSLPDSADSDEVTMRAATWGRDQVTPYLFKYLAVASDTTAAAVADLYRDALTELQQQPQACMTFIHGAEHASSPFPRPSKRLEDRLGVLLGRVFEEGIRSPQPRVDRATGEALGERLATSLARIHGQRTYDMISLVVEPKLARARPREACRAATSVFSVVAAMPPAKGGPLMRYMMDSQRAQ